MGSLVKEQSPILWWGTDFEISSEMSHLPLFPISLLVVVILSLMNLGFNLLIDLIIHSLVLDEIQFPNFRIWIMALIFINILTELQLCRILSFQFPSPRGILTLRLSLPCHVTDGSQFPISSRILSFSLWNDGAGMRGKRGKICGKIPDLDHGPHLLQCPHWPTVS